MIKRILIPLDQSPYTESVLEFGCDVAKRHGAELTGLVVLDIPGIEKSIGPVPFSGTYYVGSLGKSIQEKARKRIRSLLSAFEEKCKKEGITHRQAEKQGSPSERIIKESIFYDIVMIGLRTYYDFRDNEKPGDSLERILDHTVTPIYGIPKQYTLPVSGQIRALMALNGSLPSARALQRLAQFAIPELTEVTLLISDPSREKANYLLDQAGAYLNTHSIFRVHKEWTTQNIIHAIEKHLDWATIVVAGAHSKRGLIDFMVGSLTKYLIKEAKKPIIIG